MAERSWRGGGGNELWRYRLCDRRATTFVSIVATYEISADHRKLFIARRPVVAVRAVVQVAVGERPAAAVVFRRF